MADLNRRFLLRERPTDRIGPDTFELVEEEVPEIGDGEALMRTEWMSLDPTNRTWIGDTPTYLPPVAIGEVMRARGSAGWSPRGTPATRRAQLVQGLFGWQEYAVASDAAPLLPDAEVPGVSPSAFLGVLGMTGLTAWIGINEIGKPQAGETVVVSAAAGAVGSVAGQLAKAKGARVVGIAGRAGEEGDAHGRARLRRRGGLQGGRLARAVDAATPDGIDVDFENVGGDIMDAVFARLNIRARGAVRPDLGLQRGGRRRPARAASATC